MKIQAKAQKLRRYVKRRKQFRQNQMFANKRKNFRNLGKEQTSVEKPPERSNRNISAFHLEEFSRNEKLIKLVKP